MSLNKTVEEAGKLWCPLAFFSNGDMSVTRGDHFRMNCIADKCALWVRNYSSSPEESLCYVTGHCGLIKGE